MRTNNKTSIFIAGTFALLAGVLGCKKYDNPPPVYEELKPLNDVQRKVIVISIDGVTGGELRTIAAPNLAELQKTGKYTFEIQKSGIGNDASSWVTMATGVSFAKHSIGTDNFERIQDPNGDDHAEIKSYRNVLDYITQYKATKTAVITPWSNLRYYLRNADFSPVVSTDVAVKDSTINVLNKQGNVGAVMVNFRDVEVAGASGGFVATNDNYKNAILKADEYVGNILTALKARKNYAKEDWLVIVTTNHGGSNTNPQSGFLIASNKNFKQEEIKKRGFNTPLFNSTSIGAVVNNDNGLYDSGSTKDFTVQMQAKFNTENYYVGFLSKSTLISGTTQTGWMWFQTDSKKWNVSFGGTNNGSGTDRKEVNGGGIVFDGGWHTLTMTVKYVNTTTRTATLYTDGVLNTSLNISAHKSLSTSEKLTLGYKQFSGGTGLNFLGAELAYFNTALDAATVQANVALKDITKHPNYANLIGYWQNNEGTDAYIANKAPGGYDMSLSGPFTWKAMGTDVPPSVTPDANATGKSIALTPATVSANMLYWMNIKILSDFGIDGNPFLNQYEIEFLK
ncbi:alkaline phosphatase family protein [Pedobacter sp. ISL-68]|uniref:alkaline phosphatase family protein n=1 Tax=unclassified Pedobacter TaxID=2628915 RepID=UPI001BE705A3|nr:MULTISPECIES: alkaline phosphatase family protein [unclassified Pedobacter]MBT2564178.1 alkaline phosphatase family protein [Pedobacter sp. ISL-64]MBT2589687.1 alkaline phosphatase family protein [Pedobacter sp. ISL-68]